jgi:hypothetical protein
VDPALAVSFQQSVAVSCGASGIIDYTSVNITNFGDEAVTSIDSNVHTMQALLFASSSLSSTALSIEYKILKILSPTQLATLSSSTAAVATAQLLADITITLTNNVLTGTFDSYLQAFAVANNVANISKLLNITTNTDQFVLVATSTTSESPSPTPTQLTTRNPTMVPTDLPNTETDSTIVIIVVVVVAVVVLIACGFVVYFCCWRRWGQDSHPAVNRTLPEEQGYVDSHDVGTAIVVSAQVENVSYEPVSLGEADTGSDAQEGVAVAEAHAFSAAGTLVSPASKNADPQVFFTSPQMHTEIPIDPPSGEAGEN